MKHGLGRAVVAADSEGLCLGVDCGQGAQRGKKGRPKHKLPLSVQSDWQWNTPLKECWNVAGKQHRQKVCLT